MKKQTKADDALRESRERRIRELCRELSTEQLGWVAELCKYATCYEVADVGIRFLVCLCRNITDIDDR